MIRQAIEGTGGTGPEDRLAGSSRPSSASPRDHPDLVSVFREGQYRFFEYERQLAAIYQRGLGSALGRDARAGEYLFALGGVRFCAVRRALHGVEISTEDLHRILRRGLFPGASSIPAPSSAVRPSRCPSPSRRGRASA